MEGMFAEIMEWIKDILSIIFIRQKGNIKDRTPKKADNAQEKRKEEMVIDLNVKDGSFRYEHMIEYERVIESKKNQEQYGENEADKTRQTNKGDNNNAGLDDSRSES